MTDNLPDRLHNFAESWHRLYGMNTQIMDDAANEIERLRADRDKHANAAVLRDERWKMALDDRDAEIERLRALVELNCLRSPKCAGDAPDEQ